jgi:hypothetical protein
VRRRQPYANINSPLAPRRNHSMPRAPNPHECCPQATPGLIRSALRSIAPGLEPVKRGVLLVPGAANPALAGVPEFTR